MNGLDSLARKASKAAVLPLGLARARRPGDLIILLYHRVGGSSSEIELPTALFEKHIALLVRNDRVLTLDDALDPPPEGGVIVTFDDGYRDFYDAVLPILSRYGVPAALYLATGLVERPGDTPPLTWSQLEEIHASGLVTIGAHTHNHANLSRATEAEAETEMLRSQELIEDRLGVRCRHFAYPWAVGSPDAEAAAKRLFDTAALPIWHTNRRGRVHLHRLGRVPVLASDGMTFFRAKVKGTLNGEAVIYRLLGRGPWSRERS